MDKKKAPFGAFFILNMKRDTGSEKLFPLFISFFIFLLFLSEFFSKT